MLVLKDMITAEKDITRKLEKLGAIEIQMAGEMPIARIARCGRDHLDERGVIEGVTRPAEAE